MKLLLEEIKKKSKAQKIANKYLAQILEITPGQMSNYFNLKNRIPFSKYIKLVLFLYDKPHEIDLLLKKYAECSTNKKDSIRESIEWFYNNGKLTLVQEVINKNKGDSMFNIYRLLILRSKKIVTHEQFYIELEKLKDVASSCIEEKVLRRIATLYAFADLRSYNMIPFNVEIALNLASQVTNTYLRESYKSRIYESWAYSELKRNNLAKAEEIALKVINTHGENFPLSVNYMLILMSEIYVLSDYSESIEYIKSSLAFFEKENLWDNMHRRAILEATHDFIKIHHNKFDHLFLSDTSEEAHYLAKLGGKENSRKALELLCYLEKKNGKLSPHQLYYKALATNQLSDMEAALDEFIKHGDIYYAALSKNLMKTKISNSKVV